MMGSMEMSRVSRRSVLAGAFALVVARAQPRKLQVVVTGGHPGDPEYGCGGTAARYADAGHDVTLLYLNTGQKRCPDTPADPGSTVRVAEAKRACEILKARPLYAGQCDGQAIVDAPHYDEFGTLIRTLHPDVLFTHWPVDGHADHRATSMLAYNAWLRQGKSFAFYYYEVSNGEDTLMFSPTDYVNITETEPRKRAACYAHASQSPDKYYSLQSQVSRFRGVESGRVHAEGFMRHPQSPNGLLP
jgi:LmbE family N-acetylglucosaminyl deacetylase